MARTKNRIEKPDKVNWKAPTIGATGCEEFVSMDGMLMLRKQDRCMGAAMPMRYQVWQFARGSFRKMGTFRSYEKALGFSAILSAKLYAAE